MKLPPELLKKCWFLTGPTAVGKTELSLQLAERLDAEILSLDSMAIYRGMDVGTAKPAPAEQARVPHHLIDLVDPWDEFTVADYLAAARQCCEQIVSQGRIPLFVGGTGFYLRSLLRGIFQGPPADENVRRQLEARYDADGADVLYGELNRRDPAAAGKLHPHDKRRIVRALEVHELTGRPFSSFHEEEPLPADERPQHVDWLSPPRDWLHERINQRVDRMIAAGLVEEVRTLLALPHPLSKTARQAIGYKELFDAIEAGGDLDAAVELIKTRSRQFARRQHTWFRNLEECREVAITGRETPAELVERLTA